MKKRFPLLALALLTLTALSGCDQPPSDMDTEAPATTQAEETTQAPPAKAPNPASDFTYEITQDGGVVIQTYCGESTDVVIPPTIEGRAVTELAWSCFMGNRTITSVYLPDTLTAIPNGAFNLCFNLTHARISPNTEVIGNGAFEGCGITAILLPDSLREVGDRAFFGCKSLREAVIPAGAEWGAEAFAESGVERVVFRDGVEKIGYSMFAMTQIREVILPDSVEIIGVSAFASCPQLETVRLGQGLTEIGAYAFSGSSKLTELVIPARVSTLRDSAFFLCSSLKKVKFEGNAPENYASGLEFIPPHTVCYHEGAEGFTSPEWQGYPTELW